MTIEISQKNRDTKSWLQQTIAELERECDVIPGALNEDAAMALQVMKLAMAAICSEPEVNNHPAHGPVSINRLYQIREILSKAVAQSDGGHLGYAMADAVKVIDEALEFRISSNKQCGICADCLPQIYSGSGCNHYA
ncbi:TPA: hypothetical protein NDT34_003199 [Citrobacter freundii]|uniref:Uncharacterized protein n=1 Tax=Citrobacter freundii TaxID=546 RepID=A0AAP9Q849_CITFR|nr:MULTISPECIES: hypothetical protein [Citrobacter]EBL5610363.1 hypothetical protein [Salmonella enterica subsp. enterica serovar Typhimurium]EKV4142384.1 hypothetical protein [Citrobacter freundii]ELO3997568.1 hypothetical protein [Citrobacter freundii]MDM3055175.1 hypothetical protein [Citrobacter sp. Cf236]NTY50058.1 hypothetical protein [Citrobacter freundii]